MNVTVGNIKTQSYTGKGITPKIMVKDSVTRKKLKQGKHYTVSYENNVNAGTAVILIRGIEANGYSGVKHVYFTIQPQNVAKKIRAKVNEKKFLYTGSELTPGVNLTYNKTISGLSLIHILIPVQTIVWTSPCIWMERSAIRR